MSLSLSSIFGRQKKDSHTPSEPSKSKNKNQDQKVNESTIRVMTPQQQQQIDRAMYPIINKVALERQLTELDKKKNENDEAIIKARAEQVIGRRMASEGRQMQAEGRQMQAEARRDRVLIDEKLKIEINEFVDNLDEFITYYSEKISELDKNDEFFAPLSSNLEKIKEFHRNLKNANLDDTPSLKSQLSQAQEVLKQAEAIDIQIDER